MKKIMSLLLIVVMILGSSIMVNAANELDDAKNYTLGSSRSGSILEGDESDMYQFVLSNAGKIGINLSGGIYRIKLKLYDENGKEIWSDTVYWNDTTEEISYQKDLYLCKGKYYFSVSQSSGEGDYEFSIKETSVYESFPEDQNGNNNSTKNADAIEHGTNYIGCIAINDEVDVYQFDISSAGKMALNLSGGIYRIKLKLYDENGKEIWSDTVYWNDTTEEISYQKDLYLCKGKYYFSVSQSSGEGEQADKFLFTSANESFAEVQGGSNNKTNSANIINMNQEYNGFIAINDEVDIYRINIDNSKVDLNLSGGIYRIKLKLYDENGKEIWSDTVYWNDTTEEISYSEEMKVASGLYYFAVSKSSGEGTYSFYFTNGKTVAGTSVTNSTITVKINGNKVAFDQPPVLENGRTLVPLRAIFEALGAQVDWDDSTQTVTASKGGTRISLQIGSTQMYVNGYAKTLDVPAKLINSRTLVPVRAISEAFGCTVDWDENTQTVLITQ